MDCLRVPMGFTRGSSSSPFMPGWPMNRICLQPPQQLVQPPVPALPSVHTRPHGIHPQLHQQMTSLPLRIDPVGALPEHQRPTTFNYDDLDLVLYGYTKEERESSGHALSGLRVTPLSHGIDRILGTAAQKTSPVTKQPAPPTVPEISSLDVPNELELVVTRFAGTSHHGVFCRSTVISRGTRFGPFQGKIVNTSEIKTHDDNTCMWEIFKDGKLSHFVDGRGSSGNWMAYVNCARYAQEQNLMALQMDGEIFYEACKDIPRGSELLVWYGDAYLQFMGIPVSLKDMMPDGMTTELESGEGYTCERCGKVFAYKYYRDKHLKYTRCVDQGDRKFPCHLCNRSFEKRDRLRIHILHVHEKHRPHKCSVCGKSFSQSSSLNKHMRVHSGERPYKCVYCNKAFTASSILRTHIRQHSGEKPFKCKHCGKAFASHAAHDSHVRRTHSKDQPNTCHVCGATFTHAQELKYHMTLHGDETGHTSSVRAPTFTFSPGQSSASASSLGSRDLSSEEDSRKCCYTLKEDQSTFSLFSTGTEATQGNKIK